MIRLLYVRLYASPSTDIRRWRIDFKISELVVGELTRWRNERNSTFESTALSLGEECPAFRSFENEHNSRSWRQLLRLIMTETTGSSSALNLERAFFS